MGTFLPIYQPTYMDIKYQKFVYNNKFLTVLSYLTIYLPTCMDIKYQKFVYNNKVLTELSYLPTYLYGHQVSKVCLQQ